MAIITFIDENLYNKRKSALKRYFRKAYKELIFEILPKLKMGGKQDGVYSIELETDELFKKVYGALTLKFSVKNDIAIIEDILPTEILTSCFMKDLPLYKGIPYDTNKDLKKIRMMEKILCQKKN